MDQLEHRYGLLTAHAGRDDPDESWHGQLCLAGHVRDGAPAQGARKVIAEPPDVLRQRGQRPLVEPDDGVAEVVVVEEDQVWLLETGERRHIRPRTGDVDLNLVRAHELSADEVVQADRDVVRAQRRVLGRRFLAYGERTERAIGADRELAAQRVRPRGLQPGL